MDYAKIRHNFENHGFSTQFFSTAEEARDYLVATLDRQTIGFGGSVTLRELGLFEALQERNAVVWHDKVKAASHEIRRLAHDASVYISSVNAVAETGQLVNIDGTGNRVAATAFGPRICYYVVGKNKITPTLAEAMDRAKNVAAPQNAKRLRRKTPCARLGDKCYNCNTPERICRMTVIVDRAPYGMQSEIVFIDQDLGL